ncbi:uncharacterized protein LOC118647044 [Monomorium pharaonis]|uniref:uncharacterized protein LOC118647044 n=1 Tax=Monomorium pharaonis TaxID=307658 RepID=UPI0017463168|nr:uncharacterized protein LOC118647044 [Monomorium pharaonis]
MTALPTVLLGLRTAFKDDLKCSTAELLYGTTLRVPGEFFEDPEQPVKPEIFVQELRERIRKIRAKPVAHHCSPKPFVHQDLKIATHVFLRDDTVRRPIQPPYQGPYEVLAKINEKLYTVLVNGRPCNISTERLKPAYLPTEETENATNLTDAAPPPPIRTYTSAKKTNKRVTFQEN